MNSTQEEEFLELINIVDKASHVIGYNWPMTYFVHHNPISRLETIPFHKAIDLANHFLKSRGYLSNEMYRKQVNTGRIKIEHLNAAIQSYISKTGVDNSVELNGKEIKRSQVIRAHLLNGITAPTCKQINEIIETHQDEKLIRFISKKIQKKYVERANSKLVYQKMTAAEWCDSTFGTNLVFRVNNELIKWCGSFLDEGHAIWPLPGRQKGFYEAWRSLAMNEWSTCGIKNSKKKINELSNNPFSIVVEKLNTLGVPKEYWQDYISLHLASLHGWASFINWRSKNSEYEWQKAYPIDLIQYLGIRLFYECELVEQTCRHEINKEGNFKTILSFESSKLKEILSIESKKLEDSWKILRLLEFLGVDKNIILEATPIKMEDLLIWVNELEEKEHGPIWLDAFERGYIDDLIFKVNTNVNYIAEKTSQNQRPSAQMIFCIDVRSEPFRRNLESIGNYETYGFAGFFGIPISFCSYDKHHFTAQCPAIIHPKHVVREVIRDGQDKKTNKNENVEKVLELINNTFKSMKNHFVAPFAAVEAFGWFFGWHLIERTFFPGVYRKLSKPLKNILVSPLNTEIMINQDNANLDLSEEKQITYIEDALRTIGLTENFARLILVVGHASLSDNNPYEAALNCGACGGNSGEPNSRLFTKIANNQKIRQKLKTNGINIPDNTRFVSALHNTATDEIQIYDIEDIPEAYLKELNALKLDLERAAVINNVERCKKLPGTNKNYTPKQAKKEVIRRSGDWSETRPEWGLSGNASFIIGRRDLTLNVNLNGRTFLNSYDYTKDPEGAFLQGIMMGPLIVGQWINAEHYFSTTDPEIFGSGNKIYHNIVGNVGVMSGPQSDLRVGLPLQTTTIGEINFHEPLRLCVFVEAPRKIIQDIINRQASLKSLCQNEWIHLFSIEYSINTEIFRYTAVNGWAKIQ